MVSEILIMMCKYPLHIGRITYLGAELMGVRGWRTQQLGPVSYRLEFLVEKSCPV